MAMTGSEDGVSMWEGGDYVFVHWPPYSRPVYMMSSLRTLRVYLSGATQIARD